MSLDYAERHAEAAAANDSFGAADLARTPDFQLGALTVQPRLRRLTDANERTFVAEPRVMQVLVCLSRNPGEVLSRAELERLCWGGLAVGEDALSRSMLKLRRLGSETGAFEVETVPRVGYRLKVRPAPTPVQAAAEAAATPPVAAAPASVAQRTLLAVFAAGLIAGGAAPSPSPPPWRLEGYRAFSVDPRDERSPAVSPDGTTLAYSLETSPGRYRIVWRALDGERPVPFSTGIENLGSSGRGGDFGPAWRPDGRAIAFARSSLGRPCTIMVKPFPDGPERPLGRCLTAGAPRRLSWSSDGGRLLFTDMDNPGAQGRLRELNVASGQTRFLTAPSVGGGDWNATYSPDGRRIAFVRQAATEASDLWVMPANGGDPFRVTFDGAHKWIAWTPDSRALLVSGRSAGGFAPYVVAAAPGGRRVLLGLPGDALGRLDGAEAVVASETVPTQDSLHLVAHGADRPLATGSGEAHSPAAAPDGTLAWISNRDGTEVWAAPLDQPPRRLLRTDDRRGRELRWSPDGRELIFAGAQNGRARLFRLDASSGRLQTFDTAQIDIRSPDWSPDGRSIYFAGLSEEGVWRIHRLDPDGRDRAVSGAGWGGVRAAREGLYLVRADGTPGIWFVPRNGRMRQVSVEGRSGPVHPSFEISEGRLYALSGNLLSYDREILIRPLGVPGEVTRTPVGPADGFTVLPGGGFVVSRREFDRVDLSLFTLTRD